MTRTWLAAAMAIGLTVLSNPAIAQSDCDRKCLNGKLDQFLGAVVAKDPAKAGLFVGFRQTQNAVLTPAGKGIWETNTGIGALDRRYFDPVTNQALFFGTIKEGDKTAVASVRIKVEKQQITEAEWHVARADSPGIAGDPAKAVFDADNLLKHPPAARVVPVAQRASREALVAAVNSYFDGIVLGTGRYVQANPGCARYENGMGAPEWARRGPGPKDADFQTASDCRSGYAGLGIANVAARRYLMVDPEAQVVVASVVFIREPLNPKRRNYFMEVFYMDGGKITSVYAAMTYVDPKLPAPNWDPYDGNFPIGPNLTPAR
jgi:hypothetical protein